MSQAELAQLEAEKRLLVTKSKAANTKVLKLRSFKMN